MMEKPPKISIGLPVFNGEQFLEESINSILAQTFKDFELIISDNASTDRTNEICMDYQSSDTRIRYHRNETNIGGGNNANLTFRMSSGKYFRWAAHDDICAPKFLEKCAEVLDNDPSVVLCHTIIEVIDEHHTLLHVINREKGGYDKPHQRFRALASLDYDCEETSGLIRSDILKRTQLLRNYTDSDRTLLAEISLYGKYYQVLEPLFYKRIHPNMSTLVFPDWYGRMAWFIPGFKNQIVFPHWLQFFHYMKAIVGAPISITEKIKCYRYMLQWVFREYHGGWMRKDIKLAIKKVIQI
jgi:glycosyltransferase involved in cell wall biosynthesis